MRQFCCLIVIMFCSACSAGGPSVELGGERFSVEVVTSSEKQALGLMFRDEMAQDHGMLFVFPREAARSFWMKNTRIALDIMYFDADLQLVSVAENALPCRSDPCPAYPSEGPARYVLELNAGLAGDLKLRRGSILTLRID